ncbi:MAG: hypothetical protein SGJ27_15975 [Candidatus Melainabacteria bacterium]|nr:hypothetical protein [Candidatus Melainabacteria bacterium]
MDSESPKPPAIVKKFDMDKELDAMIKRAKERPPEVPHPTLKDHGAIQRLDFTPDWLDDGIYPRLEERQRDRHKISDPRLKNYHAFKLKDDPNSALVFWDYDLPLNSSLASYMKKLVSKVGPIESTEWPKIPVFNRFGSSEQYQIDSVDVMTLNGKNVLYMRGHHKASSKYESHVYMSRNGEWAWFSRIEYGSPDKATYDRDIKKVDAMLKKIAWGHY